MEILDVRSMYIIPGLIDSHVHLAQPGVDDYGRIFTESITKKYIRHSHQTIKSGVTTIRNMPGAYGYSIFKFRNKVNKGKYIGPRILASGPALSVPYGYFSLKRFIPAPSCLVNILSYIFGAHGLSIDVLNPNDVKKTIKRLKRKGVDFIKTTTPGTLLSLIDDQPNSRDYYIKRGVNSQVIDANMNIDILSSIIKYAHDEGLKVSTHLICLPENFKEAAELGVDSIEHTPIGYIDDETFDIMRDKNIYWVPTAYCYFNWYNLITYPELYENDKIKEYIPKPYYLIGKKSLNRQREEIKNRIDPNWSHFYSEMPKFKEKYFPYNLKNAINKGIKIVAGVDAGMGESGYVHHGLLYKELEIFVQNGMDEYEALRTATINASEILGIEKEVGTIEIGKKADIVVLSKNPIEDISYLSEIRYVVKEGKILYKAINE